MAALRTFDRDCPCPKCGANNKCKETFHAAGECAVDPAEHLCITCTVCGYSGPGKPADAAPQ